MKALARLLAFGSFCCLPAQLEAAQPKIAVLVLGASGDSDLADNLTEVLIAQVAKVGGYDIAGKEEFRSRLGVENERQALGCIEELACVSRAGAALGVTKVLAGTVGKRGTDYLFSLSLLDLTGGKTENQLFKLVPGGIKELIEVVTTSGTKIFERRPEPGAVRVATSVRAARVYVDEAFVGTSPVRSPMLEAGKHRLRVEAEGHLGWAREVDVPSGRTLDVDLGAQALPAKRAWPPYLAWGALAGAVIAGSAGGLLGILSQESPTGSTRRDQLADISHKSDQATMANVLFGVAGGLAVTSGATFFLFRRDIFGGEVTGQVAALPRGVVAILRW